MEEFTRNPTYTEIEKLNAVLVGVNHLARVNESQRTREKFAGAVLGCDHLLFEGNAKRIGLVSKVSPDIYESFAYLTSPFKARFLEQDFIPIRDFSNHGVPQPLVLFYETAQSVRLRLSLSKTVDLTPIIQTYAYLFDIAPAQIKNLNGQWETFANHIASNNPHALNQIGVAYFPFSKEVRDYDIIGPTAKTLARESLGRKGIIVGNSHVNFLTRYLTGKSIPCPRTWNEAIEQTPSEVQDTIRNLEETLLSTSS